MKLRVIIAALLLAGCTHGEPFTVSEYGTSGEPLPVNPKRLTYSPYSDSEAFWLPDGSAIVYSALRADFADTTTCLEFLPPNGGSATRSLCPFGPPLPDSTRAYQAAAVSRGGLLVFLRSARIKPNWGWSVRQLMLTDLEGSAPVPILNSPFGQYNGITQLGWLDERHLVFRADNYYLIFCGHAGCESQFTEADSGLFIATLDLTGDTAVVTAVPGTANPNSVAVADSDAIWYTLRGDPNIYLRRLSSGQVTVVRQIVNADLESLQWNGSRLALLINGIASYIQDSAVIRLDTNLHYDAVALSPDGKRLLAHRDGDLWLYTLP